MTINTNTKIYGCEHVQESREKDPKYISYALVYAGESVRFEMCRLCSTTALGTIVSARIKEVLEGDGFEGKIPSSVELQKT